MHSWGDGFDFQGLQEAGNQIASIYKALSGNALCWKEKWGTLRFEYIIDFEQAKVEGAVIGAGYKNIPQTSEDFLFSIHITCSDYPEFTREILSDFTFRSSEDWDKVNKFRKRKDRRDNEEEI
jgi:hypothetical protein